MQQPVSGDKHKLCPAAAMASQSASEHRDNNGNSSGNGGSRAKPRKSPSLSTIAKPVTVDELMKVLDARDYKMLSQIENKLLIHDTAIRRSMYDLVHSHDHTFRSEMRQQAAEARERERKRAVSPKLQPSCCGIMVGVGSGESSRVSRRSSSTFGDLHRMGVSSLSQQPPQQQQHPQQNS